MDPYGVIQGTYPVYHRVPHTMVYHGIPYKGHRGTYGYPIMYHDIPIVVHTVIPCIPVVTHYSMWGVT